MDVIGICPKREQLESYQIISSSSKYLAVYVITDLLTNADSDVMGL